MKYQAPFGSPDPNAGYVDKNVPGATAGSKVPAKAVEHPQREIHNVIVQTGLVPDEGDLTQLWQALNRMVMPGFASRLPWLPVLSLTTGAPPGAPATGDAYIVPAGATGAWAGQATKLAIWTGTSWALIATKDGHGVGLPDGRVFTRRAGVYVEIAVAKASTRAVWAGTATIAANVRSVVPLGDFSDDGQADWALLAGELVCQRAGKYIVLGGFALTGGGPYISFSMGIDLNTVNMLSSTIGLDTSAQIVTQASGSCQIRDLVVGDKLRASIIQNSSGVKSTVTTVVASLFRLPSLSA